MRPRHAFQLRAYIAEVHDPAGLIVRAAREGRLTTDNVSQYAADLLRLWHSTGECFLMQSEVEAYLHLVLAQHTTTEDKP